MSNRDADGFDVRYRLTVEFTADERDALVRWARELRMKTPQHLVRFWVLRELSAHDITELLGAEPPEGTVPPPSAAQEAPAAPGTQEGVPESSQGNSGPDSAPESGSGSSPCRRRPTGWHG